MDVISSKSKLSGKISVPGSKSHTIRSLIFATLSDGTSHIRKPLSGEDCFSTARAMRLFGADVNIENADDWVIKGAGENLHLPSDVVNVGNSGSLLYFMSPVSATLSGWSVFTGDESIRKRPIFHVVDALKQMGAEAFLANSEKNSPPLIIRGKCKNNASIKTDGRLSQYISGIMIAATLLEGKTHIELTDPKETPFLNMTRLYLENAGADVKISSDYKTIDVQGKTKYKPFDKFIASDWEGVAFPLVAALISGSEIVIENIDNSGSQGDAEIVDVLKKMGANLENDEKNNTLTVFPSRLSLENLPEKTLRVNLSGFPDAICALAVAASFCEGTLVIEDIGVCRKKETDRIEVMQSELKKLGIDVESGSDYIAIHGASPFFQDGTKNHAFKAHGGTVESYFDHRVAMALSCFGLGLENGESVKVKNAECCAVTFPHFYEVMKKIGANFEICGKI